jgi:hypothetical protein
MEGFFGELVAVVSPEQGWETFCGDWTRGESRPKSGRDSLFSLGKDLESILIEGTFKCGLRSTPCNRRDFVVPMKDAIRPW